MIKHEKMLQQNASYHRDSDINTGLKAENPASLGLSSRYKQGTSHTHFLLKFSLVPLPAVPAYGQQVVGLVAVMAQRLLCPSSG